MLKKYQISGRADNLYIDGDAHQIVKLGANGFFKTLLRLPPHRCMDLLRIAAGVYTVDRICKRRKRSRSTNEYGIRELHLTFAVQDITFWQQSDIKILLEEILYFLTEDAWTLEFVPAEDAPDSLVFQNMLELSPPFKPQNVALYSGGLDSAAGMANRYLDGANKFVLVTVSHNSGLHSRVTKQLRTLAKVSDSPETQKFEYLHSTLITSMRGSLAKRMRNQEQTQRSRAFMFGAAAVVAAWAYGVKKIEVFENGVGAINLPLMTGMLGGGLATRGAHPTFLQMMSGLATEVIDASLRFALPFENKTKAEMIQALAFSEDLTEWVQESRSCVHTSMRKKRITHCGCCPACIERRQAFRTAGVAENEGVYETNVFSESIDKLDEAVYFNLCKLDAMEWINGEASPRIRLSNHLRLTDVAEGHDEKIMALQLKHSREVFNAFGSPFLHDYNSGTASLSGQTSLSNGVIL